MTGRHQPEQGADSPAGLTAAGLGALRIAAPAEDDWTCLCGNTAWAGEGFWPCLPDGTTVEPLIGGPWDGKLVKCERCDRIMDQSTWNGSSVSVVQSVETQQIDEVQL